MNYTAIFDACPFATRYIIEAWDLGSIDTLYGLRSYLNFTAIVTDSIEIVEDHLQNIEGIFSEKYIREEALLADLQYMLTMLNPC